MKKLNLKCASTSASSNSSQTGNFQRFTVSNGTSKQPTPGQLVRKAFEKGK